jgi:hypothetical protein
MQALAFHPEYKGLPVPKIHINGITRFLNWTKKEEKNHVAWVGISITVMAAIFFPITMSAILYNGAVFTLIMCAMVSLAAVVITNLAALPTKYTIPTLFLGIIADVLLIVASFV